jgi:hypothetical protein
VLARLFLWFRWSQAADSNPGAMGENVANQGVYDGTVNKDGSEITSTWKQGGAPLSLILKRAS